MQPLKKELRNELEQAVQQARLVAEEAARATVAALGVGEPMPYKHLTDGERSLRKKLRAHGRQLGDLRDQKGQSQETTLLVEEIAYQHWHRMLFARFLAENELLIYPDAEVAVPVTLQECAELAAEDKEARNGWELAARFAARMLPQIFRPDSPVFQLSIPLEHQRKLEHLLEKLPAEVFTASDALGWVYQFWQSQRKDQINASEVKIGARELPAVTQLFTESYMVHFLLDNSLGAWWAFRCLSNEDLQSATDEPELRRKAARPGLPLKYLRFVKEESGSWIPAAGTFGDWPECLGELKTLDPCCGSGHFLVAAFFMLVPMRMELEGLSAGEAVDAVLRDNLHGLEIDRRCVELAAFALAFAAWRYPGAGGYRELPELNLACSGLSVSIPKEEWRRIANDDTSLRIALDLLHDQFSQAPLLGSLINPAKSEAVMLVEWDKLSQALVQALQRERTDEEYEAGVAAQGLARAAEMLTARYHWVITNVPFLHRGKQGDFLRDYCSGNYKVFRNDLATVFLERCLEFCLDVGTVSIVLPQNWLFQVSDVKLREQLLHNETWRLLARLGEGGFGSSAAAGAFTVLFILSRGCINSFGKAVFTQTDGKKHLMRGLDVSGHRGATMKAKKLAVENIMSVYQNNQLKNPDKRIALRIEEYSGDLLKAYSFANQGIKTGDDSLWRKMFWEIPTVDNGWELYQSTVKKKCYYGGREYAIDWRYQGIGMACRRPLNRAVGSKGVAISQMRDLFVTLYGGGRYDSTVAPVVPFSTKNITAIWCFCSSPEYHEAVRKIDQKINVTNATLVKVPFDLERWQKVAAEKYPHGLPKPYSDDPTQWIFHGHPCGSVVFNEQTGLLEQASLRVDETVLQVAVSRLLGYRWPTELDQEMELSDESRYWVQKSEELLPFADGDGIACIPPVRGEAAAADRLLDLLVTAYDKEWHADLLSRLLVQVDHAGKTLESWLRDKFFSQHCRLFHHRPFVWHIWDGLHDGFAALVNYHRLDRKNLETLTYTYLGDWISRQKQDLEHSVDGAAERLAAAENLQKRLQLIIEGEKPYDIFVRWKPIEEQPMGWEPDLNDGVRLNIRPFLSVPTVGLKDAGILRFKPNIRWTKDRGKDVSSAPWYHLFKGERINDHHLTLEEKKAARKAVVNKNDFEEG